MVMGFIRAAGKSLAKGQGVAEKIGGVVSHAGKGVFGIGEQLDPTKIAKPSAGKVETAAQRMGQIGTEYLNKNVPKYQPQQVSAKAASQPLQNVQGMAGLQGAVDVAGRNVQTAGKVDPRTLAFLQAAQQSGQYSPQALQMMQRAAMGQGPSAAQTQMQSGVDAAIKAQLAAAGSRGFSAAAMRGAQAQGAEMQQAAVNQAAILRAQEQQAAQQAFLQASLDQEQMQRQAALQAGQINLQQDLGTKQAIQDAINAQLAGAGQFAGFGTDLAKAQAEINLRSAIANQGAGLSAAELQQRGQLGFAGIGANLLGAELGAYGDILGLEYGRLGESGKMRNEALMKLYGGLSSGGGSFLSTLLTGGGGGAAGAGGAGAAGAGAAVASDSRGKTDIKANKETQAFLNALTDNEYRYKDTSKPGTAKGTHYGPMAQDLAKTKMGRTVVIDGPDGMMVDSSRGFLLALSGLANINKRLAALEGK